MDGCPLGLGLVVEDKPTEFSCMADNDVQPLHQNAIACMWLTLLS